MAVFAILVLLNSILLALNVWMITWSPLWPINLAAGVVNIIALILLVRDRRYL
jgi:hypothetical protein